jgi:L-alanine-DL-glutamate epimerase-like enolase superfamily enzyme
MRIQLLQAHVHYNPEFVLHTASSGAVDHLAELYLVLQNGEHILGIGEVRENICYLNGLTIAQVRKAVIALLEEIVWESGPQEIIHGLVKPDSLHPAVARALVDSTMHDWWARQNQQSITENLGFPSKISLSTNQCIFWCSDEKCLELAQGYIARNFKKLKLRVGITEFSRDLARIARLRNTMGPDVELSVDANGSWKPGAALKNIEQLAAHHIAYVEQPIAPGNWSQLEELARKAPIPIMLDESITTVADVKRATETHENLAVHLKIVKIGGITPLLQAAEVINQANGLLMIGQMNEGAGATAAAYQCAAIARPKHIELYGADGLQDDVLNGVEYTDGKVIIRNQMGVGVQFNEIPKTCLWEKKI